MSTTPYFLKEDPHVTGTSWEGYSLTWTEDDTPIDLTGAAFRFVARDASGTIVLDWELGNALKPGLSCPEPTTGVLHVDGPGVLTCTPGMLKYDLKGTLASGEVFIDLQGTWQILESQNP